MKDPRSGRALSDESLADTALQILKHSEFVTAMDETSEHNLKKSAKSRLEYVIPYWLQTLDETDKRGFSAFPKPGTQQYRLEDHVWIWKALNSIENLDLGTYLRADGSNEEQRMRRGPMNFAEESFTKFPTPMAPLSGDYRADQIQRKVLKRFTTENTASGQRMIAVSRTPTETRFMFHSTDSVLLYNSNAPFFDKARPLWKATMESQKFYQENDESTWDSPLRYAAALIMSLNGCQITGKSSRKMFDESRRILLRISPPNGLFAGQIDPITKEPQIFQDKAERDFYWNVSFEIPGILWEYGVRIAQGVGNNGSQAEMPAQWDSAVLPTDLQNINLQIEDPYQANDISKIERFFPSCTLNDRKEIVELADEWLYSYPDFLDFDPGIRHRFEDFGSLGQCGVATGDLLSKAIRQFKERQGDGYSPVFANNYLKGIIVDVGKTMRKNQRRTSRKISTPAQDRGTPDDIQVCNNDQLFRKLDGPRVAKKAKKRLIWIPKKDNGVIVL
ncbi:Mg2+ transporter protein CorA-like/Zinc transport protein ZntB [Lasiodiplodia theobromae]|uniref:Mg2+ transporter protein CorA-like/Zinc transport protein ZntB n=1 Tax=Lasiodiplodia theobromae TaxID=45133 RepID=UPI0015C33890|nr:Mg2+ transporter protein CorA-like/Zinc transport protein ZntB [Lasiodiplodia theobromae]KAF4534447.1 Mg2+ transporter protein CorA-like/Zinc transport protein ZntB [Lasiodiplodia theobromae]